VASFYSLWAGVVAFTFAISGPMHVVSPGTIAQSMSESTGLRSPAVAGGLSRSVGLLELASATAILFGSDRIALAGLLAASLILVAYVAYIWWLLEARPGVACGCGRGSEPATIWHLGRTCILLGAALLAAGSTLAESVTADGHEAASLAMSAVAALLIWMLPAAMRTTVARQELAA